jgi:hypothetical protein
MRIAALICMILTALITATEDAVFRDIQLPTAKGELTNATLTFSDSEKKIGTITSRMIEASTTLEGFISSPGELFASLNVIALRRVLQRALGSTVLWLAAGSLQCESAEMDNHSA